MKKIIVAIGLILLLGCVKVGYRPFGQMAGGYKDKKLDENSFLIEYVAYATTSDQVIEKWRRRASELCSNGYDVLEFDSGDSKNKKDATTYDRIRNDVYMTGVIACKN